MREQIAEVENAGVGKPHGQPNRYYTSRGPFLRYFLKIVLKLLGE